MTTKNSEKTREMVMAALCLALALLLPFLTGQIKEIGNMLCPMHIPVLLCAFLCRWKWAGGVGAAAPLLRSSIWGMPPMGPITFSMTFELAAYGLIASAIYRNGRRANRMGHCLHDFIRSDGHVFHMADVCSRGFYQCRAGNHHADCNNTRYCSRT